MIILEQWTRMNISLEFLQVLFTMENKLLKLIYLYQDKNNRDKISNILLKITKKVEFSITYKERKEFLL